jgi:DNA repair exonuclease SbcCD ATPase subunit
VKEWGRTDVDFYVVEDGEMTSLNGQSRPETEKAIRRVLGSFEDFCLTSFSPQSSIVGLPGGGDIISCKETDRKKILYRVLDLDLFERKAQAVKEVSKSLHSSVRGTSREDLLDEISTHRRKLDAEIPAEEARWRGELERLQARLESLLSSEQDLQREHDSIKAPAARSHRDVGAIEREIASCEAQVRKIEETIAGMGEAPSWQGPVPDDPGQDLRDAETALRVVEGRIKENKDSREVARWKLRVLDDVPCGESFPTCRFLIDAFAARGELPVLDGRGPELESQASDLAGLVSSLRDKQREWDRFQAHRRDALKHGERRLELMKRAEETTRTRSTLEKELASSREYAAAEADVQRKSSIAKDIQKKKSEVKETRNELARAQREVERLSVSLGGVSSLLENAQQSLDEHDRKTAEAHVCELYVEAFGKNGIPRLVLARALPLVNAEINRILSNAVDFTVSLEHDESDQSVGLYLQYGQYRRRNIALAGGAERFIASIAIRAALLGISSLPRTNMFIIDEGFGKLDPSMIDSVQRMFDYLRTCFDHVLIVSHLDSMRDVIDNVIEIGSDQDRYAHVEAI